jgi:DnaJ-class molecular chaperone
MKPNVTCDKCDGSGTFREWSKADLTRRGGWRVNDVDCPRCLGIGKHPERKFFDGIFYVHSTRASHLSVAEILDVLEIPYAEEEE